MKEEALKLADELENGHTASQKLRDETANMLRQQADRIAELEKQSEALADEYAIQVNEACRLSYEIENLKAGLLNHNDIYPAKDESFDRTASHMANEYVSHYEPTAWINHIKQTGGDFYELNVSGRGEPLYRHPPQTKPLSDDEIGDCVDDCFGLMALQHKYTYSIDQVQEYGLKLCKAIEERHGIK